MEDITKEQVRKHIELQKQYENETGQKWFTNPVSHGEIEFASWEYQEWLENKVNQLKLSIMPAIAENVKNLDLDSKATLIIDRDLKYGDGSNKKYWELTTSTSDEIESEELLQLSAENFPEGTKLYLFMSIPYTKKC